MKGPSSRTQLAAVYLAYAFRYLYPLVMLPYYGRVLGPNGYGIVLAGASLSNSLWLFVGFGFPTVGSRDTVHARDSAERAEILKAHVTARLLLCVPAMIAGLVAIYLSLTFRSRPLTGAIVIAMGLTAAFNVGWYLVSTGRALASIRIEVVGFVLSFLLIVGFVHHSSDVKRVFPLLLASSGIQLAMAYWLIRSEFRGILGRLQDAVDLIRRSTTIFIYGGTSVLLAGASTYLLSTMAGPAEVSSFGVAERLIAAGLSLMSPAAQILVPKVTYMIGRETFRANRLTRRIFVLFFSGAAMSVLATVSLSGWLIPLVFGVGFEHSVAVLNLMVFVLPVSVCTQVLGMYFLVPRKLERLLARAGVLSAIVNLACAVPLASHWGALGMASARLIGELTMLAVLVAGMWRAQLLAELFDIGGKLAMPANDNTIPS
ncbi:oligosaccharide flippase family protein [Paraburkholderia phenazinium]|uniref:Polysaccharide transporter, PST family n=1 Tax=Paraburkholderia phenazinium TaxID=60549 RepID=A0A1G7QER3_9BURK|nr:oligosaccharide flippase family protein [Paraburkholderia phenazinium]SDF96090.1 polysaccharide transporter, PST family [Paraburkholderia phenazinium]